MDYNSSPRILLKSIRYPTYQLYAVATSTKESADHQLIIGALTVLEWLRTKFREFEIPSAFQAPLPEAYANVSIYDLKTAHIDCGYTVETISIPEEKVWALRLIEPDLSTRWKDGGEVSTAIPGRIFETNIAFRVVGTKMYLGVEIIVSEPENTRADVQALVLRPAVVSTLAQNSKLGLSAGNLLKDQLWELNSKEKQKRLKEQLGQWMVPAVVFCDYIPSKNGGSSDSNIAELGSCTPLDLKLLMRRMTISRDNSTLLKLASSAKGKEEPLVDQKCYVPYDTDLFVKARLAYVHSFHLPAAQFDSFEKIYRIDVKSGDILFLEPYDMGGGYLRYPYSEQQKDKNFSDLMELSRDYLRKRSISFSNVLFLSSAKKVLLEKYRQANMSVEDTIKDYEARIQALQDEHKNEVMERNDRIQQQANKITRLKNQLEDEQARVEEIRSIAAKEIENANKKMSQMADRIQYLESLPKRPKTPQEIPNWVQSNFAGRLEFHQRAIRLIQSVSVNDIDMQLLCDAIEYLAYEYRDLKAGIISWDDVKLRCSEKYGRPFEVVGCGDTSIEMYSHQYKIKYKLGFKGKPIETPLNEHLKVGNTAGNLIRIYFLYDDERKVIVVGSLPNHLRVSQIQA